MKQFIVLVVLLLTFWQGDYVKIKGFQPICTIFIPQNIERLCPSVKPSDYG